MIIFRPLAFGFKHVGFKQLKRHYWNIILKLIQNRIVNTRKIIIYGIQGGHKDFGCQGGFRGQINHGGQPSTCHCSDIGWLLRQTLSAKLAPDLMYLCTNFELCRLKDKCGVTRRKNKNASRLITRNYFKTD